MKNSWSVSLVTLHLSEAMQHNFVLKFFTDCRLTTNSQSNENHNHHAWTYHSTKTSTQPRLTQSSKSIPHTLNQTTSPPFLPFILKQVLETHEPSLFQPLSLPLESTQGFSITTSKISYSLIESQYFPIYQPAATNSMNMQSTYTPHL